MKLAPLREKCEFSGLPKDFCAHCNARRPLARVPQSVEQKSHRIAENPAGTPDREVQAEPDSSSDSTTKDFIYQLIWSVALALFLAADRGFITQEMALGIGAILAVVILVFLAQNGAASASGTAPPHDPPEIAPVSDDFLQSYEWRRLRYKVIRDRGRRCECCGATPADGVRMHVDHIRPRRLFPELALDESNLQVLCEACNHGKGNWDQTDWRNESHSATSSATRH